MKLCDMTHYSNLSLSLSSSTPQYEGTTIFNICIYGFIKKNLILTTTMSTKMWVDCHTNIYDEGPNKGNVGLSHAILVL